MLAPILLPIHGSLQASFEIILETLYISPNANTFALLLQVETRSLHSTSFRIGFLA